MRRWLIQLRKEQQLTQQEVAAGAHIDRAYYAQIENGTRNPSMTVASRIASYLHINPSLFFSEQLSEPFEAALTGSPITIAHCDLEHRYTWLFNNHTDFTMSKVIGKRVDEIFPHESTEELLNIKKKVVLEKKPIRKVVSFPLSEGSIVYDIFCKPIYDSNGNIIGTASVSMETMKPLT
ncbi:helix-turn-helix domain-containing protein [Halobacillus trueperi]|uniref:Helix-turn-helix domain-containing protein n=1 Tax=Halobacillus trueperi TaxID=156205 RepID=A0A3E0J934_9BACI|nr:helix-turn-helix domain-containing protein [Halobacillus trueperi]REJ09422.1 helix-turn-helix domain-containing protein [Halobacillus trueperi]